MAKSVERTKKKVKPVKKAETIKNDKNGNQNINQISIKITDGSKAAKAKKKEEADDRRKKRKEEAIENLKRELDDFRRLKDEAQQRNIQIPASLGMTPENLKDVKGIKQIKELTQEMTNRIRQLEELIAQSQKSQQSQQLQPLEQGGVFAPIIQQSRIIPSPQIPAQPQTPSQPPAQQPQIPAQQPQTPSQPPAQQPQIPAQQPSQEDTTQETLKQIRDEIIARLREDNKPIPADIDEEAERELENNQQPKQPSEPNIPDSGKEDRPVQEPKQIPNNIQQILDNVEKHSGDENYNNQLQQAILNSIQQPNQENLDRLNSITHSPNIPAQADEYAIHAIYNDVVDSVKGDSSSDDDTNVPMPDFPITDYNKLLQEIDETSSNLTNNADKYDNIVDPEITDKEELLKVFGENEEQIDRLERSLQEDRTKIASLLSEYKQKIEKDMKGTDTQKAEAEKAKININSFLNSDILSEGLGTLQTTLDRIKTIEEQWQTLNEMVENMSVDSGDTSSSSTSSSTTEKQQRQEDVEVEKLTGVKERVLNGRTVPRGWYSNYWLKYQELTNDIKDDLIENEGGIFQIPADKLAIIKNKKEQLKTDYNNFKNGLTKIQKGYIKIPTVAQYDNAIFNGLNSSIESLSKLILNQERKQVSKVILGDVEETPLIKSTRQRFIADGDFVRALLSLEKQYRGTIEKSDLRTINDKIEQDKSLAQRTYRTLGSGEVDIKVQYTDYIKKLNDLQTKVNEKILTLDNPPKFVFEMEDKLLPGEKIVADAGYIERTPEGKFLYHGRNTINMIAQAERKEKSRGGKLPEGVIDITGKKP
jgi:hypothetical protein